MSANSKVSSLCRVCLVAKRDNHKSLYDKYKGSYIFEYINLLAKLTIHINDNLPNVICNSCFLDLETTLNFIENCEKSNSLLKSYCEPTFTPVAVKIKSEYSSDTEFTSEEVTNDPVVNSDPRKNLTSVCIKSDKQKYVIDIDLGTVLSEKVDYVTFSQENATVLGIESDKQKGKGSESSFKVSKIAKKLIGETYECHDCGVKFSSKCKLRVHWKNTHLLNLLICNRCKRIFKSIRAYNTHVKANTRVCLLAASMQIEGTGKARVFHCKECVYKTGRIKDMDAHLRTHSGEKPYRCTLCPNKYTQMNALQAHEESFHKMYLKEITCQYCGKQLLGRGTAYRHLKMHRDGKMECTVCKKVVKKSNINIHMKRHSGKTYTCEICASTFYTSGELCNHKRWVHGKNPPHKCELCDYTTLKKFLIKKHQSKHTDTNVACSVCGMFFLSTEKLESHRRIHFEKRNFECPQCKRTFLNRESIRKHMVNKHLSIISQDIIISKCELLDNIGENKMTNENLY